MFARLTFVKITPEHIDRFRKTYHEEVIPVLRQQKGLIYVMLLEPTEKADDFISITEWDNEADAKAYESSGVYQQLVDKVRSFFTKEPVLKIYSYKEVAQGRPAMSR